MHNHGLLYRPPLPEEWKLGGETGITQGNVFSWTSYLPYGEHQSNSFFDTLACTHFASGHIYETFIIYLWKTDQLSQKAKDFFKKFLKDPEDINSFRVSKQFSAIVGNNTKQGNYFTEAWNTWRKVGAIPDSMLNTFSTAKSWEEYHDKNLITQEMLDVAKESLKYVDVLYQWLAFDSFEGFSNFERSQIQQALKTSPINIGTPIPANHSTQLFSLEEETYGMLNTYTPFIRHVNYDVNFALQGVVKPRIEPPSPSGHMFTVNLQKGSRGIDVFELQKILVAEGLLNKNLLVQNPNDAYFGTNTFNGVIELQEKYALDILYPSQLNQGTGYVGLYTRAYLNTRKGKSLLDAITQVESGGNDFAIGDITLTDKAYGCLQIRQGVVDQVNAKLGTSYLSKDCLGNRSLSFKIWNTYWTVFNRPTDEDKAKSWNGGPYWKSKYGKKGYEKYTKNLDDYWIKVQSKL